MRYEWGMGNSEIYRRAREAVHAGQDRRQVYDSLKDQIRRPVKLAVAIANIPTPELRAKYRVLNTVLFVLLLLAALSKLLSVFAMFQDFGVLPALGVALLGLLIPVACAVEVYRFSGQIYLLIPIFCLLGLTQILRRYDGDLVGALIDGAFLLLIAALSLVIKFKVFPNIGIGGVKKDAQGQYLF